jgi:myo-inositol-1(or 4)-monophosphatase
VNWESEATFGLSHRVALLLIDLQRVIQSMMPDAGIISPKGGEDLIAPVDLVADDFLQSGLKEIGPSFEYDSEENPRAMAYDGFRWVVDPVDGSQNAAFGLPLCGSTVALMREDEVILAAAAETHSSSALWSVDGVLYLQRADESIRPIVGIERTLPLPRVSLLRGSTDGGGGAEHVAAYVALQAHFARVYETRAPVVDLFLAARGGVSAFVCTGLTGYETPTVIHLLKALGFQLYGASNSSHAWALPDRFILATSEAEASSIMGLLGW